MKDSVEFRINSDGSIGTIYQTGIEDFADEVGASISKVCRASDVEWESTGPKHLSHILCGWSVRSFINRRKALRLDINCYSVVCSDDESLLLALFPTREEALQQELKYFWELKNG